MVILVLMAVVVLAIPVPAIVLGARNLLRRSGHYSPDQRTDRMSVVLLVASRLIGLLFMTALSAVVLVSTIGAAIKDLRLPSLVYVFFVLDLLLAALVLLTFGRGLPRGQRRSASPARR